MRQSRNCIDTWLVDVNQGISSEHIPQADGDDGDESTFDGELDTESVRLEKGGLNVACSYLHHWMIRDCVTA
jgi:hypothetical protein